MNTAELLPVKVYQFTLIANTRKLRRLTYSDWTMLTEYTNELVRNLLIVCGINRRNTCYYRRSQLNMMVSVDR